MHGTNNRIFFSLRRYYIKCRDVEFRFKGKEIMLRDGKVKIIYKNGTQEVMKQLNKITKAICKITYKSNCD